MQTLVKNRPGQKTYLLRDKNAYIVATLEMDDAHGISRDSTSLATEIQHVLHGVGRHRISKAIRQSPAEGYDHRVIKRVNIEEEKLEGCKKIRTSMIKVSCLRHKRSKQSNPRLTWLMFQNFCIMYRNIKEK